ncbi:MAG: sarcosine oxidase subunit delta [Actinomycetota bacterium]
MLLVPCPNCGPRNASDLRYVGETPARPDPRSTTSDAWRDYLYIRDNSAGWRTEQWYCRVGCRRFFTVERNTSTNDVRPSPLPRLAPEAPGR